MGVMGLVWISKSGLLYFDFGMRSAIFGTPKTAKMTHFRCFVGTKNGTVGTKNQTTPKNSNFDNVLAPLLAVFTTCKTI